jgi:hypothetical protein
MRRARSCTYFFSCVKSRPSTFRLMRRSPVCTSSPERIHGRQRTRITHLFVLLLLRESTEDSLQYDETSTDLSVLVLLVESVVYRNYLSFVPYFSFVLDWTKPLRREVDEYKRFYTYRLGTRRVRWHNKNTWIDPLCEKLKPQKLKPRESSPRKP